VGRVPKGTVVAAVISTVAVVLWGEKGVVLAALIVLVWALWVADAMSADLARDQKRERELSWRVDTQKLPEEASEYLGALDAALDLPAFDRVEIRAELADHLTDSIAAIEAEGLGQASAVREALARLGGPRELAGQLTRAHQTRRRLLAGAAGGVFQTGIGVVWGSLLGVAAMIVILLAGAFLATTLLWRPVELVAGLLPRLGAEPIDLSAGTAIGALVFCVPAFAAARNGIRTYARLSGRPSRIAGWIWALAGFAAIAGVLLFVIDLTQSWLAVVAETLVPLSFVAGALVRTDRDLFRTSRGLALAGLIVTLLLPVGLGFFLLAAGEGGSTPAPVALNIDLHRWDSVAPAWSAGASSPVLPIGGGSLPVSVIDQTYEVRDPAVLASYRDLRFELWKAVPAPGFPADYLEFDPDPAATGPFAIVSAAPIGNELSVRIDMSHQRATRWLLFLTGIGPDGLRYRLEPIPDTIVTSFSGTVWDWLTASD
jgi:hypothetical protein